MGRRKKTETYEPHNLLDEDCRHYIESAITNYHNICKDFFSHTDFLEFWFNHIEKEPTPQNAALCAFAFFKQNSLAENYLENLRKHYNRLCDPTKPEGVSQSEWEESDTIEKYNRGKSITQWIKSYQSGEPCDYIATDDIDWAPIAELTQSEKNIALELSFGWSIARLWQLLKKRNKEYFVERFLEITIKKDISLTSSENKTLEIIPDNLVHSLTNINPEKEPFFDRYLHFFSPEYLNDDQLCNFWKKACISSIDGVSKESARRQPLDKIWLLARFFNVHFYSLDFIAAPRGIPARAVKQFETLANPSLLNKIAKEKISTLSKKEYRKWGRKGLPPEEIFQTLAGNRDFSTLKDKAEGSFSEFKNDNSAALYKKSIANTTESSILGAISFFVDKTDSEKRKKSVRNFLESAQTNKFTFITAYTTISLYDYLWINLATDEDNSNELQEEKSIEKNGKKNSNDVGSVGFYLFLFASAFSWSLEHEKNFFLVSINDLEKSFLEKLPSFTNIVLLLIWIYNQNNNAPQNHLKQEKHQTL